MSRSSDSTAAQEDTTSVDDGALDLVWGASAIAKIIGKSTRATFHLLEDKKIPGRKCGSQWVSTRKRLKDYFEEPAR